MGPNIINGGMFANRRFTAPSSPYSSYKRLLAKIRVIDLLHRSTPHIQPPPTQTTPSAPEALLCRQHKNRCIVLLHTKMKKQVG